MIINEKETFFFDLDGTLIDSFHDVKNAINKALVELNFEPLETIAIKTLIGPNLGDPLTKLINNPKFNFKEFEPIFSHHYTQKNTNKTSLYPNIENILKTLANKKKNLFILTNKPAYQAIQICKQLHISQYMLEIIGPDTYEPKPSPKAINNIIQNYNLNRDTCVMIGDTEIDIQTAKAANITSIAVTYGYRSKEELSALNPDYTIDKLNELFLLKTYKSSNSMTN
tara:strand:- start:195 stop:872 length:678 start_codon:yes stop_codon:yes gene_type:complete